MTPVARSHDWRERQAGLTDFARAAMPYPLTFATLSGADLYGFPSADGDYDVRAAHVLPLRKMIVAPLHGASWHRKGLLYQYRVAMTGIVVLETEEIEANVLRLNERFRLPGIEDLVSRKVSGEMVCVEDDAPYLREIASLEPRLDEAYERSALFDCTLPEVWAAAEDLLFRCRLAEGG